MIEDNENKILQVTEPKHQPEGTLTQEENYKKEEDDLDVFHDCDEEEVKGRPEYKVQQKHRSPDAIDQVADFITN